MNDYNKVLQCILCKVAEIDDEVDDKEIEKIDQIYFKLTKNHFTKFKIFRQILDNENHETVDSYLKNNIKKLNFTQKIDILNAVREVISADGINHINEEKFLDKLKKVVYDFLE